MSRLSLITPTHKPDWLVRLGESISRQADGHDLEWLLIPNNGGTIPSQLTEMPFVRVLEAPERLGTSVGALKKFGFSNASGDVLVELDHDDELLPDCLDSTAKALNQGGNRFFYSGTYETKPDLRPNLYGAEWGWRHSDYGGMKYNVPFPATARSLCEIFFAPNHVRAWTKEAYQRSGGHDPMMDICDDQDLMIKTYLSGAEFIMDERPLYWQKATGANTQLERNAKIQTTQAEVRDKYLEQLAMEWSKRNGLLTLDFGGAHSCPQGYTPVDKYPVKGGIQCDVTNGLPFEDRSVGLIRACDFLEHIPIGKVVPLMNEIHRVMAHGGFFLSSTPSSDGRGAFCDPTHCSFWNQLSWRYYTNKQYAAYVPEIACKFQAVDVETIFPSPWHKENQIPYVSATLCADHGDTLPGQRLI